MAHEVIVPRLGWSMDEGTFSQWLKADGEWVDAGDLLFVLEGDKAAQEIESFDAGFLHIPQTAPQPGDTVAVGQRLAWLVAEGEQPPADDDLRTAASQPPDAAPTGGRPVPSPAAGPAARRLARELQVDVAQVLESGAAARVTSDQVRRAASAVGSSFGPATARPNAVAEVAPGRRIAITPRARRLARQLNIGWTHIRGTGRNGRIRERDVRGAAGIAGSTPRLPAAAGRLHPPGRVRRAIARRMVAGVNEAAPVTLTTTAAAENFAAVRDHWKAVSPESSPTYSDLLIKLVAQTLVEQPTMNACWHEESVYQFSVVNIALAVDTPEGLVAPVLENVPDQPLAELSRRARGLAEAARTGKLSERDLTGGTFTVTNLGPFGVDHFTPILNLPQAGILGVGRLVQQPVVRDNQLVVGRQLALSLTFDHRVVDGATAARWLQHLVVAIENPPADLNPATNLQ